MSKLEIENPSFYLTVASPCPYLPDREERKVFTHLVGQRAADLNDILTQGGFRRSQSIAYRPACEACQACISVRVLAEQFTPSKSQKRILNKNTDLISQIRPSEATKEQYSIFRRYVEARHKDGGMADMMMPDFAMMIEDTHVDTHVVEYRKPQRDPRDQGKLVAACIIDEMEDGLSMVYSFFDPDYEWRSFGSYMILDQIQKTKELQKPNLYLGYWVEEAPNMQYKARYQPLELLTDRGWVRQEHK